MGGSLRLVLCGGGTGGHVYPSLSVAEALSGLVSDLNLLYMGTEEGAEASLLERTNIPYRSIRSAAVRGRSPVEVALATKEMAMGVREARKALAEFKPDAIFTTGGYVSMPVSVAARLARVPLIVFLPDVRPGWAVTFASRLAKRVATTTERALAHLPRVKTVSTGYPVRALFWEVDRSEARKRLDICDDESVLLVAGGSRGARRLNAVIGDSLAQLLPHCTILHVSGLEDEPMLRELADKLPLELGKKYKLFAYLHDDMARAMAAADLAVLRSGASVMGELPALGLPAVLVPYPYAGGHQKYNAEYLGDAGAAIVLDESQIESLAGTILALLKDDTRRQAIAEASRSLAKPDAARDIAQIIIEAAA